MTRLKYMLYEKDNWRNNSGSFDKNGDITKMSDVYIYIHILFASYLKSQKFELVIEMYRQYFFLLILRKACQSLENNQWMK